MGERMSRASDDAYNARRRFTRAAQRYLKKAQNSIGQTSYRYRELARESISKAAELYERKANIQRSRIFTSIASELGVNLSEYMVTGELTKREQRRKEGLISTSEELVISPKGKSRAQMRDLRREQEAQAILNSPIGSRIYAGLVDKWTTELLDIEISEFRKVQNTDDINAAIMKYYGVSSMMDVIEILESKVDLYSDPESIERYDAVSLAIAAGLR